MDSIYKTFYGTFGWGHPLRDYYVIIKATTEENADEMMFKHFGKDWSTCYPNNLDPVYAPKGPAARIEESTEMVFIAPKELLIQVQERLKEKGRK